MRSKQHLAIAVALAASASLTPGFNDYALIGGKISPRPTPKKRGGHKQNQRKTKKSKKR